MAVEKLKKRRNDERNSLIIRNRQTISQIAYNILERLQKLEKSLKYLEKF